MNHLSDSQLNEYLDNILDPSERRAAEAHLIECDECRARLDEIQSVFSTLKSLPDAKLSHDLSTSIASRLPQRSEPVFTPIFAVQLGAALGMTLFIAVEIAQSIRIPPLPISQISLPEFRFTIPNFPSSIPESLFPVFRSLFSIYRFSFPTFGAPSYLPQLPEFRIPLSSFQTSIIVIFTLLLGLIGNAILLCERAEVRK
jgi:Putative zinc-finger